MNALHQAVTRAIADDVGNPNRLTRAEQRSAAAAAIAVCLAEAQRAIEALPTAHYPGVGTVVELAEALAALAALAEEQA